MKVLNIHGVDDVRLDPIDPPSPGDSDVVVKVKACGICGSDLSYIKIGGIGRGPGEVTPIKTGTRPATSSRISSIKRRRSRSATL